MAEPSDAAKRAAEKLVEPINSSMFQHGDCYSNSVRYRDAEVRRTAALIDAEIAELRAENERLLELLKRCYQSGHREGWEASESVAELMAELNNVLREQTNADSH